MDINGTAGPDTLVGTPGDDRINGNRGNDNLLGQGGDDRLYGGPGDDFLVGGSGFNYYSGGDGFDRVSYTYSHERLTIDLEADIAGSASRFPEILNSIEGAVGGTNDDFIYGSSGVNRLSGWSGNDLLDGRRGNDTLVGGPGEDKFLFDTGLNATTNVDFVPDFAPGVDEFRLAKSIFQALPFGTLPAGQFREGATNSALDGNDHIIYNNTTGWLSYDRDGVGGAASVHFATIHAGMMATLSNSDFFVI